MPDHSPGTGRRKARKSTVGETKGVTGARRQNVKKAMAAINRLRKRNVLAYTASGDYVSQFFKEQVQWKP